MEFSELIFYTFKSINEIRELEIVKNALNERYKRYFHKSIQLEKEIEQIRKISNANYSDFSSLNKDRLELRKQLDDNKSLIDNLTDNLQVNRN